MSNSGTAQNFICKCGKQTNWIEDGGKETKPCPSCGRKYKGKYNPKTLQIDAIEIKE
ncbi:MAG: hypothetical protein KAQ85_01515 [Thermodesulfovibrionia bacterium]|nr:hypothetical protein [Thermodesulfovibrionia bacterium]